MTNISDVVKYAIGGVTILGGVTVLTASAVSANYIENKYHAQNVQADIQKMEKGEEVLNSSGCQAYLQQRKDLTEFLVQQNTKALKEGYHTARLTDILFAALGDNPYCHE